MASHRLSLSLAHEPSRQCPRRERRFGRREQSEKDRLEDGRRIRVRVRVLVGGMGLCQELRVEE